MKEQGWCQQHSIPEHHACRRWVLFTISEMGLSHYECRRAAQLHVSAYVIRKSLHPSRSTTHTACKHGNLSTSARATPPITTEFTSCTERVYGCSVNSTIMVARTNEHLDPGVELIQDMVITVPGKQEAAQVNISVIVSLLL